MKRLSAGLSIHLSADTSVPFALQKEWIQQKDLAQRILFFNIWYSKQSASYVKTGLCYIFIRPVAGKFFLRCQYI